MKILKQLAVLCLLALLPLASADAAFRSAATSNQLGSLPVTSFTATAPSGYAAGDILVAMANVDGGAQTVSCPTAWTKVRQDQVTNGDGQTMALCWKVAAGGDSFLFNFTVNNDEIEVSVAAYTGRNTTTPLDVTPTGNNPNSVSVPTSPVSVVANTLTSVQNGDDIVYLGGVDVNTVGGGTWSAPSGMTLRTSSASGNNSTSFCQTALADLHQTTAAATGNKTGTWTNSGDSGNFVGYLVALAPAAAPTRNPGGLALMGVGM